MTKTPPTDSPLLTRLLAARERIARGWCQRFYSTNFSGMNCQSTDDCAARWCAAGAVAHDLEQDAVADEAVFVLSRLVHARYPRFHSIIDFNDDENTTQQEVLQLFDLAIAETFAAFAKALA